MGKIVVTEFITLNGVVESPQKWSFPYWGDDIAAYKKDELFASGALLLGRTTYEGFSEAWPDRTDEDGFADRINSMPKYVASTTLADPTWNATVIEGDVPAAVARLRDEVEGDVMLNGSVTLAATLIDNDLVDEYRLLTYPIVVPEGKRLFAHDADAKLELVSSTPMASGAVLLTYRPAR